eukprot:7691704-Pyramimonas_sp.AAC.1
MCKESRCGVNPVDCKSLLRFLQGESSAIVCPRRFLLPGVSAAPPADGLAENSSLGIPPHGLVISSDKGDGRANDNGDGSVTEGE